MITLRLPKKALFRRTKQRYAFRTCTILQRLKRKQLFYPKNWLYTKKTVRSNIYFFMRLQDTFLLKN